MSDEKKLFLFAALLMPVQAKADTGADILACRKETDSLKRLLCYDAIRGVQAPGDTAIAESETPIEKATKPLIYMSAAVSRLREKDFDAQIFNRRIEVVPSFHNDGKKTIVAISHTLQVADAFGDLIINSTGKLDITIPPGQTVESPMFYFWDDNPFINNEPFDQLVGPLSAHTAKVSMDVMGVVYSDGSTETLDN